MAATIFSTQLQKLRKSRGVKQEQLAEHLGVSTQAVSKWENGSYPDGDLLPKIAKFFGVSIDYLYGDERENMRFDERIVEYMRKEEGNSAEKCLELLWMAHGWATNETTGYFPIPQIKQADVETGTCYIGDEGYSVFRLREDLRYVFLAKRPENGYEEYLLETKNLAEIFSLLCEEEALKVLLFMMSLDASELVRAETVAGYLGIAVEQVESILKRAAAFGDNQYGMSGVIFRSSLLKEDGTKENLYMVQQHMILAMLRLMIVAKDVIHPTRSYRNLSVNTTKPLIDREKLLKLLKEKNVIKES